MENDSRYDVFEEIGGYRTHYHEMGKGKDNQVLLIHGSGLGVSAWANWRTLMPLISEKHHVFAVDLIGFGDSEKPKIRYTKDVWIDHLIAFIEKKMTPPIDVIGNSLGGCLSLHICLRRPDLIKKQVLMGSPGLRFQMTKGLEIAWGSEPTIEGIRKMISIFAYDQAYAQDETLIRLRYEACSAKGVYETFSAMFPEPRQQHLDALSLTEEELASIETPTLFLHGREDQVIPVETSWKSANLMPNAELHVFPKCGHWIQIEQTAAFHKQVQSFIS